MINLCWPAWNVLDVCTNYVEAVRLDARGHFGLGETLAISVFSRNLHKNQNGCFVVFCKLTTL